MRILVTGVAGFIGSHVAQALLGRGDEVVGIDNLNDYYDVKLKEDRLKQVVGDQCTFIKADFADRKAMEEVFSKHKFDVICHLGAQAGVRYSIDNPFAYEEANLRGTLNLFELAKRLPSEDEVAEGRRIVEALLKEGYSPADIEYAVTWTTRHVKSARKFSLVQLSIQEALEDKWTI